MQKGICKLCLEQKNLCKKSHIIPRFLYKFITGEKNEIVFITAQKSEIKFNGEYEGNILCENCDSSVIGKLDDYFSKFIHDEFPQKTKPRFEKMDGKDVVVRENDRNYNYNQYKLFLISLLWRSSISSRPLFKQIKLPEYVEEDLRKMIIESSPGTPDKYPCFINLPPIMKDKYGNIGFHTAYMPTMSPVYIENGELKMCEFIIEGVHYYFIISKPSNMNILPAVDIDKLTMGFSTAEEQMELIKKIAEFIKQHPPRKRR